MLASKMLCPYAMDMDTVNQLRDEIEAFCKAHEMSGSRFSELAVGDPSFWFKFSRGRVPTLATYDKLCRFMRDYDAGQAT